MLAVAEQKCTEREIQRLRTLLRAEHDRDSSAISFDGHGIRDRHGLSYLAKISHRQIAHRVEQEVKKIRVSGEQNRAGQKATEPVNMATSIVIRRGDPNGPESKIYVKALNDYLEALPAFHDIKGPKMGNDEGSPRPHVLPPGSVFLYAEETGLGESRPHSMGSLCMMPLHAGTSMFRGLPEHIAKASEIKRMIVFPEQRGKGVASKLIAEAERIAKDDMEVDYMVVETLWLLDGAQSLYKAAGYVERDIWGGYLREDSVCFEKWL